MEYRIRDNIGSNGITLEDGQKVYEAIYPELIGNREVVLDFAEVRIVASPFLNAAVGQLLRDISPEDLNRLLKITNVSNITGPILRRVIENAKEYYSNELVRQAVDAAIAGEAGESDGD